MIRTSVHTIKFSNIEKKNNYKSLLEEGRNIIKIYIDYLWENGWTWEDENTKHEFNIEKELYEYPKFLKITELERKIEGFESKLSSRFRNCLMKVACGALGASLEKQRKRKYILEKMLKDGETPSESFLKKYKENLPIKPNLEKINIEVDSKCAKLFLKSSRSFDGWINLYSLGETKKFNIPIKFHKHNKKFLKDDWRIKSSFLLKDNSIDIRYEKEVEKKEFGEVVGADQGLKDVLVLSDKQVTPKFNKQGKSLESILEKLSRKKKGSKNFKDAQAERTNFINWSINQLDLSRIKCINLEKIVNIRYKNRSSRKLSHWTFTTIRDKVKSLSEISGVHIHEQECTYRSQRCSSCGMVLKSNRKGKDYICKNCGSVFDADYNASCNHEVTLPEIPIWLKNSKLNKVGFFWKENGFFDLEDKALRVPCS